MAKKKCTLTTADRRKGGNTVLERYGKSHFSEMKREYWRKKKKELSKV